MPGHLNLYRKSSSDHLTSSAAGAIAVGAFRPGSVASLDVGQTHAVTDAAIATVGIDHFMPEGSQTGSSSATGGRRTSKVPSGAALAKGPRVAGPLVGVE